MHATAEGDGTVWHNRRPGSRGIPRPKWAGAECTGHGHRHSSILDPPKLNGMRDCAIDDFKTRHIPFEGCFNFRDIGGYHAGDGRTIRWGRYFRAGRQDRMTLADLEKAATLRVRTQIDLRRPDEIRESGRGPFGTLGARYVGLSVLPDGSYEQLNRETGTLGERYLAYFQYAAEPWRGVFEVLANNARYPVLLHCTAGKDRTGVITALLLSILGVDRAVIEADFALTNRDVRRHVDFVLRGPGLPEGMTRETFTRSAGVREDAISVFLDGIEESHGGPPGFLRGLGVDDAMQDAIRESLLEEPLLTMQ